MKIKRLQQHNCAVVLQDSATQWIRSYPSKTTSAQETMRSIQNFSRRKSESQLYEQFSGIRKKLARSWIGIMVESAPHSSETHRIAERVVRRCLKEGISSVLGYSWLWGNWWAEAKEWYCNFPKMWKIFWQMARHFVNVASIHHLMGRSFFFGAEVIIYFACAKINVECISSAYKSVVWWWSICSGYGWSETDDTIREFTLKKVQIKIGAHSKSDIECVCHARRANPL